MAPARFVLVLAVMVGCAPRPEIASRPEVLADETLASRHQFESAGKAPQRAP